MRECGLKVTERTIVVDGTQVENEQNRGVNRHTETENKWMVATGKRRGGITEKGKENRGTNLHLYKKKCKS